MEKTFTNVINTRREVLVVDDEFINRELLGMILSDEYDVLYAENGREALDIIREKKDVLSLVLLDLLMPEVTGFEVMEIMREDPELRRIPIIVLTSEKSAEVKSLKLGAADFITKPYDMPEVILARVFRIIELSEGKNIISATERDELTGLYTGSYFYEYAQQLERFHPDIELDSLVFNIEHFHTVNELYGRDFGDNVLRRMAEKVSLFAKDADGLSSRMDADNFYVICAHRDNYSPVIKSIQDSFSDLEMSTRVRLRLGVYPKGDRSIEIERRFDRALLACNTIRGNFQKNIAEYDSRLHEAEIYSERLINDLPRAIRDRELKVFFQPKFGIQGSEPRLRAAEALIRWQHPEFGMVSPGKFIPLFEGNGMISQVDHYVWSETAAQIARWRDEFGYTLPVSVNVSRIDMYDPELNDKLLKIVRDNGLETKDLHLEVTESAYAEDSNHLIEVVESLRALGFPIEMDDFGSGYSSLNMLFSLPIDILKMDMRFMQDIETDSRSMRLVELILDIAKYLKSPVVAEGVETGEQCELLRKAGCELIQGYYFSKPVPPEDFKKFFSQV